MKNMWKPLRRFGKHLLNRPDDGSARTSRSHVTSFAQHPPHCCRRSIKLEAGPWRSPAVPIGKSASVAAAANVDETTAQIRFGARRIILDGLPVG